MKQMLHIAKISSPIAKPWHKQGYAPGCEKTCRVGEKLIVFLFQIPDLFFCKIPFSNHITINVAKLDLITDSADESVFLNIHNLSCLTAADCFSFFYVFSDCDILVLGNYYDENPAGQLDLDSLSCQSD